MKKISEANYLIEEAFKLLYEKARQNNVNIDKYLYIKFNTGLRNILFKKRNQDINKKAHETGKFIYRVIDDAIKEKRDNDLITAI